MEREAESLKRLRLRYRKAGILRFLSHLEMSRTLERAVRRAGLPVAFTAGFHPHPRISFGTVLPVGWSGEEEYFELRLKEEVHPASVVGSLNACLPDGIEVREAKYVSPGAAPLMSLPTISEYRVRLSDVPSEGLEQAWRKLEGRELEVERKGKLRRFPVAGHLVGVAAEAEGVRVLVRSNPLGGPRVTELLSALGRELGSELEVIEVTRTRIWVEIEERSVGALEF